MNKYFLFFILSILTACGSVKKIYAPASAERIVILAEAYKFLKKDQLLLCFTKTYKNDRVIIKENDSLRLDTLIITGAKKIALALKVNNKSKITVGINDNKLFTIDSKEMAYYKFVYIEKKRQNILIDFNNGSKKLD